MADAENVDGEEKRGRGKIRGSGAEKHLVLLAAGQETNESFEPERMQRS